MPLLPQPKLPQEVSGNWGRWRMQRIVDYASQQIGESVVEILWNDQRGAGAMQLSASGLLVIADLIYRVCGLTPKSEALRVEVLIRETHAAAGNATTEPSAEDLDEVSQIRRRMLEGR